jgi:hypothetical protein
MTKAKSKAEVQQVEEVATHEVAPQSPSEPEAKEVITKPNVKTKKFGKMIIETF